MLLIVGLGNPGKDYQFNRHNAGFMAVDKFIYRYNFSSEKKKFNGLVSEGNINGEKVIALKPQTYMNLSGQSVQKLVSFYKIPIENIIVFHDDMDVAFNKIKAKVGGGAGGHNGIKNIDANIGKDYKRIRIGVSHPQSKGAVVNYVLGNFSKAERDDLDALFDKIIDDFDLLVKNDFSKFIERVNKNGI
jgi:PTH1 family peptidyl-tRNA hydrolase